MTKKILSYGFLALVLIFLYAPILLLVVYSFTPSVIIGQWSGFSFKLYADLFMTERVRTMILNTVVLAVVAATLSTILGTIGAIGIYYSRGKIRQSGEGRVQPERHQRGDRHCGFAGALLFPAVVQ